MGCSSISFGKKQFAQGKLHSMDDRRAVGKLFAFDEKKKRMNKEADVTSKVARNGVTDERHHHLHHYRHHLIIIVITILTGC